MANDRKFEGLFNHFSAQVTKLNDNIAQIAVINSLDSTHTTLKSDIASLQTDYTTNSGNIVTNTGNIATNKSTIASTT